MDTKLWIEESDNYTDRAKESSDHLYSSGNNPHWTFIQDQFNKFTSNPNTFLDIGCAYGSTIYALKDKYKSAIFYGVDPGVESIKMAKSNILGDNFHFSNAFSHELPFEDSMFDVVILSMVLQWIPRKFLIKTIAEVDRVLKKDGLIYIQDFLPNKPISSKSRHDSDIFIFKNDYSSFFTTFGWYKEVFREIKNSNEGEDQQRVISILKKYCLSEVYHSKDGAVENKHR